LLYRKNYIDNAEEDNQFGKALVAFVENVVEEVH